MGSVQLSSSDFGEARWLDVAATKDCRDATGRLFVGCSVGTIIERAEDLPVKKKSWFGSSKKKEKAPVVTKAAVVETPEEEVPVAQQQPEEEVDLPAMPTALASSRAHRSKEGLSSQFFEARRRVAKRGVLAWRSHDLGRGELVALAASADAVVLEAPLLGGRSVSGSSITSAGGCGLRRRIGKRRPRSRRSQLAGEAKDLYLDDGRARRAACWRAGVRAICVHQRGAPSVLQGLGERVVRRTGYGLVAKLV